MFVLLISLLGISTAFGRERGDTECFTECFNIVLTQFVESQRVDIPFQNLVTLAMHATQKSALAAMVQIICYSL